MIRASAERAGRMIRIGVAVLTAVTLMPPEADAQPGFGTEITYQGSLLSGGSPASGLFDFEFELWDDPAAGATVAPVVTAEDLAVSDGVFTTGLDFGPGVFDGSGRWLAISVRPGASVGAYTPLTPRVELRPVPHALFAGEAAIANTILDGAIKVADFGPGLRNTLDEADGDPNAVFVDAAGNVGISEIFPQSRLHIVGDGGVTNARSNMMLLTTAIDNTLGISLTTPFANWLIGQNRPPDDPGATDHFFIHEADADATRLMIQDGTGHVGIGTLLPMARLHIGGTAGVDGIMFPDGTLQTTAAAAGNDRPPVAVLEADRRTVQLNRTILPIAEPAAVMFDLALSYDPEGGPVEFGFDPRGDQDGQPAWGPGDTLTHNYVQAGSYLAEGWIRDASGRYDVDRVHVEVLDSGPVIVDSRGIVGLWPSMKVVNGNPAIAYYNSTDGDLMYVRAMNAEGTEWSPPVTVDAVNDAGEFCSLEIVAGFPAISYYERTAGDLKFVRATDADGSAWSAPVGVDTTGDMGQHTSLAVVSGNPAISYHEGPLTGQLRYVRAVSATGSAWGTPVVLDTVGTLNPHTSLVVVSGNPAVAFTGTFNEITFVRATDTLGNGWGAPVTLDNVAISGGYASMAVVAGNPAIAFHDGGAGDLLYRRATTATGSAWGTAAVNVESSGITGRGCSLAVIGGVPAISYHDVTNTRLRYAIAGDATGTAWPTRITVDEGGIVGRLTSVAEVAGAPAIAYTDSSESDLKFAR